MADTSRPLRWARPDDAEAVAAYHHATFIEAFTPILGAEAVKSVQPRVARFAEWFANVDELTSVVATDDNDEPIAHTIVMGSKLAHLFVNPAYHRQGIGSQLLAIGERLIRQAGHREAQLQTRVGNTPAIELYLANGWMMTDEIVEDPLPTGGMQAEHVLRKDFDAPTHVEANRENWDDDAANWVERGRRSWAAEPHWGEMAIAEADVEALPPLAGRDVVELGCGTGYVSAWCLRAGAASAVGLDNSPEQLRSAAIIQAENDMVFPLVWADAERLPFADDSFDVAINEYGAGLWCDPDRWIPEAARVLRPGGSLMFLTWSHLMSMAAPDFEAEHTSTQLLRAQRGANAVTFPDTDGVQFTRSHGEWIELLTSNGFVIDRLIELYAPDESAGGPDRYSYYDASWARRWPPEEIWTATYRP